MSESTKNEYIPYIIGGLVLLVIVVLIVSSGKKVTSQSTQSMQSTQSPQLTQLTQSSQNLLKNNNLYYPDDNVIYENIFNLLNSGIISKSGNPVGWDDTTYRTTLWNGFNLLRIGGSKNDYPNGLRVSVPFGMNVIWIRCLNDRWISVQINKVINTDNTDSNTSNTTSPNTIVPPVVQDLGNFCSGYRNLHKYSPDGAASGIMWNVNTWFPIPVSGSGDYVLTAGNKKNTDGTDLWISGLAFSTNPWNHAFNSGLAYCWSVNEGNNVIFDNSNWNNDILARIALNTSAVLYVPVVPNGKDKLFYIVEHNNNWDGAMHNKVLVEDQIVSRLRSTWDHPLARSVNSKIYNRFLATLVPKELIGDKKFIKVTLDLIGSNNHFHFREAGTIDLE